VFVLSFAAIVEFWFADRSMRCPEKIADLLGQNRSFEHVLASPYADRIVVDLDDVD
jgi:hypothetical protein